MLGGIVRGKRTLLRVYGDGRYVDELQLRMDLSTWDERWSATEREYSVPLGDELEQ